MFEHDARESAKLRLGTVLVFLELIAVLCLFAWLDARDEDLAAHGIHIEQMTGEARE